MYIAKLQDYVITPGTEIELQNLGNAKFKVLDIRADSFSVVWISGSQAGERDSVPYSLFGTDVVQVSEITDETEPNQAFKLKKIREY